MVAKTTIIHISKQCSNTLFVSKLGTLVHVKQGLVFYVLTNCVEDEMWTGRRKL